MSPFASELSNTALPSDWLLAHLGFPAFRWLFQLMIFAALLESGAGFLNAINQRIAMVYSERGRKLSPSVRFALPVGIMTIAIFLASRIGLVTLIAKGYRGLTVLFLCVYIAPLMTLGLWRLMAHRRGTAPL